MKNKPIIKCMLSPWATTFRTSGVGFIQGTTTKKLANKLECKDWGVGFMMGDKMCERQIWIYHCHIPLCQHVTALQCMGTSKDQHIFLGWSARRNLVNYLQVDVKNTTRSRILRDVRIDNLSKR